MVTFLGALIAACLAYSALVVAPVILLMRAKLPKVAALVFVTACLYCDHERNWDMLSYPHWLLRGFDDFYPATLGVSVIAFLFVLKINLDRLIGKL
ncbi:hypothetical protein CA236_04860 [Sphingomonas sp. ABOLG]|uniref:hypothetical protein n=1 Tax=Sphingomonas sp. ABOLG TaxID=1985880 RepID=UPI000F7DA9EE|nr:hypothetical protein [Sphingomonas sp. ABOLG]RSV19361.1 hypothetical protein CA236_04860 [Sphingomonas sp. ABOLG]